jgi:hypothetical protein
MQAVEGGTEELAVIHRETWKRAWAEAVQRLFRAFPSLMSSRKQSLDRDQVLVRRSGNPIPPDTTGDARENDPNGLDFNPMKHLLQNWR